MPSWISKIIHPTKNTMEPEPAEAEEWFRPRTDGEYEGGPPAYRFLTFTASEQVIIADSTHESSARLVGSYTGAGRFSVSRPFERPIVFVAGSADDDQLQLRITDTSTQHSEEHTYHFRPRF